MFEHADEVVAAYLKGVRSDDAHQAYKAAEAWLSRVHGRPTQTVETKSNDDSDELILRREQRHNLLRELAANDPALLERLQISPVRETHAKRTLEPR